VHRGISRLSTLLGHVPDSLPRATAGGCLTSDVHRLLNQLFLGPAPSPSGSVGEGALFLLPWTEEGQRAAGTPASLTPALPGDGSLSLSLSLSIFPGEHPSLSVGVRFSAPLGCLSPSSCGWLRDRRSPRPKGVWCTYRPGEHISTEAVRLVQFVCAALFSPASLLSLPSSSFSSFPPPHSLRSATRFASATSSVPWSSCPNAVI